MFTGNIFVCLFSMTILNYKERLYQICRSRTTVRSLGSIALAHVFAVLVLLYYICIRVCSLGSIVWHSLTCSTVVSVLLHSYICLQSRFNCIRSRVLVSVLLHSTRLQSRFYCIRTRIRSLQYSTAVTHEFADQQWLM